MSYPQVKVGRQVKRADGVLMEEVITTRKEGNQLVSTTSYRPVGQKEVLKPANDELLDLEALLDESPGLGGDRPARRPQQEGRQPRAQAPQNPRHTPQEAQPKAAPVPVSGEDTTMARLASLKQLFQNGDMPKEEYDARRKAVLDEMMSGKSTGGGGGGGGGASSAPRGPSNPSRAAHAPRAPSPPEAESDEDSDGQMYIQDFHKDVYASGHAGEARDKNATMTMNPTGVDGIYFTGKAPEVVQTLEEALPDRKDGPEHKFRVIKTTIKKELLDTGVVRVTRTEKAYDGYTGAYLTMSVKQKMKPKLSFHSTDAWDDDEDFNLTSGTSKVEGDAVQTWHQDFTKQDDDEYSRVMQQGVKGTEYQTRNVNNTAGKGDFGWDGVHRYPGGKPMSPPAKQPKKGLFGRAKKTPAKDPNDKWSSFQEDWGDDGDPSNPNYNRDRSKPEYKDAGKKGMIFNVKKAGPKRDKMMGEGELGKPKPNYTSDADREYRWDDGRGRGGFGAGEQWGEDAKQHEGKHAAGGSHFVHQDRWK